MLIDERAIGNELDRRLVSRDRLNTAQHRARESARHGTSIRVRAVRHALRLTALQASGLPKPVFLPKIRCIRVPTRVIHRDHGLQRAVYCQQPRAPGLVILHIV